jgi:prephenate dehydrogenase
MHIQTMQKKYIYYQEKLFVGFAEVILRVDEVLIQKVKSMSLAYYFRSKGVNVIGFSSRSNNTEDFELYSREKLINNSDIIFITTNDDNIQTVWNKIKDMNLKEKIICHCSGSVSSEIFKGADSENVCSVHPMLAFNSKHTSLNAISNAFFTVEGGGKAVDTVSEILSLCGNRFKIITPENKAKYHAAACFASNFVLYPKLFNSFIISP